jgi:hypothetical protein
MLYQGSTYSQVVPNPTLPMLSDLASFCEEKMQSLADFLAEFEDYEDGKMYTEFIASKTEPIESEPMASRLEP